MVELEGSLEHPTISLRSAPVLEQGEILALLLFDP